MRSRFNMSFRVSQLFPSTSFQAAPNCSLVYPVFGARPFTAIVAITSLTVGLAALEVSGIPARKSVRTSAILISQ